MCLERERESKEVSHDPSKHVYCISRAGCHNEFMKNNAAYKFPKHFATSLNCKLQGVTIIDNYFKRSFGFQRIIIHDHLQKAAESCIFNRNLNDEKAI